MRPQRKRHVAPLNTIGQPYDDDAVMLGRAFADAATSRHGQFWRSVDDYIDSYATDRRYRLVVLDSIADGTPVSCAIVHYRHRAFYIWSNWDSEARERTYYVERLEVTG